MSSEGRPAAGHRKGREGLAGFSQAVDGVDRCYTSWARLNGVSHYRLKVLYYLVQEGPFTQKGFSEQFGVPRQSLNNVIKQMVKDGVVALEPSEADRKEKMVVLTRAGQEEGRRIIHPLFEAERAALEGLSHNEIDAVTATLGKFSGTMRQLLQQRDDSSC